MHSCKCAVMVLSFAASVEISVYFLSLRRPVTHLSWTKKGHNENA